ncbi:hypothetical protein PACILC2_32180 [Paenibacillus cisolokensis]|uniref:Flavodoxin-like fold domain-containing protein n=1 Tax=Paenibacillus cisolokensis TaxID=1658519 RepID=A0ABQ4N8S4_9BACL|nr:hypothetical protein PACILC2_32180 [Paenibacillus cisolokensis]
MEQFLIPLQATTFLTEMIYLPPFILYGTPYLSDEEIQESAERLAAYLTAPYDELANLSQTR